jgi:hypothetical protein
VLCNGKSQFLIDILREGMNRETDYFRDNITDEIARLCSSPGRRPRERSVMLHLDNARICCARTVRDRIAAAELERMEHAPYSPDRAPCDFFLFGRAKRKLMGKQYDKPEYVVSEVRIIIRGIGQDVLKSLFKSWKGRLLDY